MFCALEFGCDEGSGLGYALEEDDVDIESYGYQCAEDGDVDIPLSHQYLIVYFRLPQNYISTNLQLCSTL